MMSNTLKEAADSTVHTMSHLVHDARERLEHLPLPHHRTPWWRSWWATAIAVCLVGAAACALVRGRRARRQDADRAQMEAATADRPEPGATRKVEGEVTPFQAA